MTEQEIDDTLGDIQSYLFLQTALFSFKKGVRFSGSEVNEWLNKHSAKLAGLALIGCCAIVRDAGTLLLFVFGAYLSMFALSILYTFVSDLQKPPALRKWEIFLATYLDREGPLEQRTGMVNTRIANLYETEDGPFILLSHQAARLLNVHQKENSRLIAVHSRVLELEKIQKDLEERLMQLRQLNELSTTGELGLAEVTKAKKSLTRIRYQLQKSIYNLEMILLAAENELKARKLHQEINEIADVALKTAILPEPMEVLTADPLKEIEERISAEIEIYLRLETEARHYLDQVQTVTSVSK